MTKTEKIVPDVSNLDQNSGIAVYSDRPKGKKEARLKNCKIVKYIIIQVEMKMSLTSTQ